MSKLDNEHMITKLIKIDRVYPEDLQSFFVANFVIQHQPDHFVLQFFETWPPAIIGETEAEREEQLKSIDNVKSKCVARLVLTPERMKNFMKIMNENYSKYVSLVKKQSGSK